MPRADHRALEQAEKALAVLRFVGSFLDRPRHRMQNLSWLVTQKNGDRRCLLTEPVS